MIHPKLGCKLFSIYGQIIGQNTTLLMTYNATQSILQDYLQNGYIHLA